MKDEGEANKEYIKENMKTIEPRADETFFKFLYCLILLAVPQPLNDWADFKVEAKENSEDLINQVTN